VTIKKPTMRIHMGTGRSFRGVKTTVALGYTSTPPIRLHGEMPNFK